MTTKGTATLAASLLAGAVFARDARASDVDVSADIATSDTWTADNVYHLKKQIYVLPGATLTIEAGTVVASDPNDLGSLAVCKGAQIFVQGTHGQPVIMTSTADVATWTGGDPRTGTWRAAANEWGNLTVMGEAYISENAIPGNTPDPSPTNVADMEGLTTGPSTDRYGGGDDDDDSGSISYLSIRYAGKVVAVNRELNGLSLGGIGRETSIHHVEVMNNVDDGVEVWGGTVNLKYLSVWNVGDDSIDVDQGWRGKAQFVLVVQGYSVDAAQGSGIGDNCFELDGAEDSDYQPVTTAAIYNATVIGQPVAGDQGTAWRDNCRIQVRNSIFMDLGEVLVKNDNVDGDGANGYGHNGTLDFATTWATAFDGAPAHANDPANPADFYQAQVDGNLAEIRDSVFFRNQHASAYTEATSRGVFDAAMNNVLIGGTADADAPVSTVTRGAPVFLQGGTFTLLPVAFLDPRPANEALTSVDYAPEDGFFSSGRYRGAFAPGNNWLGGWTASQAFGFTPDETFNDLGFAKAGTHGDPILSGTGDLVVGNPVSLDVSNAVANAPAIFVIGFTDQNLPYKGGVIVPSFDVIITGFVTDGSGAAQVSDNWPAGVPGGFDVFFQFLIADLGGFRKMAFTNALKIVTP
jgi:hypothetical protein